MRAEPALEHEETRPFHLRHTQRINLYILNRRVGARTASKTPRKDHSPALFSFLSSSFLFSQNKLPRKSDCLEKPRSRVLVTTRRKTTCSHKRGRGHVLPDRKRAVGEMSNTTRRLRGCLGWARDRSMCPLWAKMTQGWSTGPNSRCSGTGSRPSLLRKHAHTLLFGVVARTPSSFAIRTPQTIDTRRTSATLGGPFHPLEHPHPKNERVLERM